MAVKGEGRLCSYCERKMTQGILGLRPTRDHVIPKSKKGTATVWACFTCNNMKGDMMPDEWAAFCQKNPQWWGMRPSDAETTQNRIPKPPPIAETLRFLSEANKRAIQSVETAFPGAVVIRILAAPKTVPIEYTDPKMQQAFENVYKGRLHILRVPIGQR